MSLTREEVLHIAQLARLALSEADVEKFRGQLSQILDQFATLAAVETEDVPPTAYPLTLENVARADEPRPSLPVEAVLANAPRREGDFFRVRRILE